MKRILVFNGYYIPAKKYGGPTVSMKTIVENCGDLFDFYIVAANHDFNDTKVFEEIHDGWNLVGKAKVLYIDPSSVNYRFRGFKEIIEKVKPDVVWLMGILVPADKWFVSKICNKLNIPYLISPRGELCENAIRLKYQKKILVLKIAALLKIFKNAWYHSTSPEETEGILKYIGVKKERIFEIPNIPINLVPQTTLIEKRPGSLKVIFVSRIHEKKNLLFAIQVIKQLGVAVIFDIYGPIESEEYWEECLSEIKQLPENVKINYCGILSSNDVSKKMSDYHCFLFPTFSENYGHVIAEALSVSCPVILSKGTTPWDDIDKKAGYVCELKDSCSFVNALQDIASMDFADYSSFRHSTANYYRNKNDENAAVKKHIDMLSTIGK